jgi:D-alanyl-D-alanine carboxypeptidase
VTDLVPGLLAEDPPVTVRMLLAHTSGIFDETNNLDIIDDIALLTDPAQIAEANELAARYAAGESVLVPDSLLVALAEAHGRDFPSGTDYGYSNLNYQVAAIVLEAVTAQPIAELLRERIVEPLGLEHTTMAPPDLASPEFRGYGTDVDDGSLVDITDDLTLAGNGASGGVVSTADELAHDDAGDRRWRPARSAAARGDAHADRPVAGHLRPRARDVPLDLWRVLRA